MTVERLLYWVSLVYVKKLMLNHAADCSDSDCGCGDDGDDGGGPLLARAMIELCQDSLHERRLPVTDPMALVIPELMTECLTPQYAAYFRDTEAAIFAREVKKAALEAKGKGTNAVSVAPSAVESKAAYHLLVGAKGWVGVCVCVCV